MKTAAVTTETQKGNSSNSGHARQVRRLAAVAHVSLDYYYNMQYERHGNQEAQLEKGFSNVLL